MGMTVTLKKGSYIVVIICIRIVFMCVWMYVCVLQ